MLPLKKLRLTVVNGKVNPTLKKKKYLLEVKLPDFSDRKKL